MNNPSMEQNRNDQRISSLIDMGKVVEVNLSNYTARVQVKPTLTTGWLRMGMIRALGDQMTWPYEVGEEVVFYTQSGDMKKGAILCALPNGANPANGNSHVLRANVIGDVEITAGGNISLTASGNVTINGARIDLN